MQPKIYTFDQHSISSDQIDPQAHYVIQKLRQAGYSAYLVGGGIRDLLLKKRPKDFDISTSAKPEEIRALFRNAILIGRRFRLAHVRFGKKIIEVATFRSGDSENENLIVRDNVWGTEEEDVLRRDFTINGLFYDPEEQTIIDYVNGFYDIEQRLLRAIGPPKARFIQDPVRMIRLIKFCARFDLHIDPPTHEALVECREHIIQSSPARILEELLRMLESGAAEPFFRLLHQYGLLKLLIAPFAHFIDLDPDHRIAKILHIIDAEVLSNSRDAIERSTLIAALCFPIFELTLHHWTQEHKQNPHLGIISQMAYDIVSQLFSPFFQVPRRLQATVAAILTTQFRLVPLEQHLKSHRRIPPDAAPRESMHLLKMRCSLDPKLLPIYTSWNESNIPIPPKEEYRPIRRRRRR